MNYNLRVGQWDSWGWGWGGGSQSGRCKGGGFSATVLKKPAQLRGPRLLPLRVGSPLAPQEGALRSAGSCCKAQPQEGEGKLCACVFKKKKSGCIECLRSVKFRYAEFAATQLLLC